MSGRRATTQLYRAAGTGQAWLPQRLPSRLRYGALHVDVAQGGLTPTPGPKSVFFAVDDVEAIHERASRLGVLAPYQVHGEPAGAVLQRPWGERSFYVVDPWGNDLCFCEDGTLYT